MDFADLLHAVKRGLLPLSATALLAACTSAPPSTTAAQTESPAPERVAAGAADRVLLWGDTHVHSRNSVDAYASGTASVDADTAYRFVAQPHA